VSRQQFVGIFILSCTLRNIMVICVNINGKCLGQLDSVSAETGRSASVSAHLGRCSVGYWPKLKNSVSVEEVKKLGYIIVRSKA